MGYWTTVDQMQHTISLCDDSRSQIWEQTPMLLVL